MCLLMRRVLFCRERVELPGNSGEKGIPLTLITDNMAAHFMRRGGIKAVFVGARPVSRPMETWQIK